jgi:DMSO/TMAO reductase YedYZ molybdopterin-dependent catalytic subunit
MDRHFGTRWNIGALVGGLLTAPLLALFYLAHQVIGTLFLPFGVFDWLARVLPGGIIGFGINLMVSIIVALNLGDTSRTAKMAENAMAIIILLLIGIVSGGVWFIYLNRRGRKPTLLEGTLLGALVGLVLSILALSVSNDGNGVVSFIWIVVAFGGWGAALTWVYNDLLPRQQPAPSVEVIDRRQFLIRLGGAAAAITVLGAGVGALASGDDPSGEAAIPDLVYWSDKHTLPNANDPVVPAPGTRPEFTPVSQHYRIDINSLPPVLNESDYKLKITGLVDNPMELTLQDIRTKYPSIDQFVTLSCISNPVGGDLISTQRWTGVSLKHILDDAKPNVTAIALHIKAADGFEEWVSRSQVNTDERVMLCYAWDDQPLPTGHGFPLRIYIPDRYGMKQPKWITEIELTKSEEEGYWVVRGWDPAARVRATAVIDSVAVDKVFEQDGKKYVPVGGIAFAGARGISKVEVKVDEGDWQEAKLRTPISDTTWTIWRYDWLFEAGNHTFTVRCVDGSGTPQIEEVRGEAPSGATGLDSKSVSA